MKMIESVHSLRSNTLVKFIITSILVFPLLMSTTKQSPSGSMLTLTEFNSKKGWITINATDGIRITLNQTASPEVPLLSESPLNAIRVFEFPSTISSVPMNSKVSETINATDGIGITTASPEVPLLSESPFNATYDFDFPSTISSVPMNSKVSETINASNGTSTTMNAIEMSVTNETHKITTNIEKNLLYSPTDEMIPLKAKNVTSIFIVNATDHSSLFTEMRAPPFHKKSITEKLNLKSGNYHLYTTAEGDVLHLDQRSYIIKSFLNDLPNYQLQLSPVLRRFNDSAYKVALIGTVIKQSGDSDPLEFSPIDLPEEAVLINSLKNATDSSSLRTFESNKRNATVYNFWLPNQTVNTNDTNSMNLTTVLSFDNTSYNELISPSPFMTSNSSIRPITFVSEAIEVLTSPITTSVELRNSNQSEVTTESNESDQISIITSQNTTPISSIISSPQITPIVSTSTPIYSTTSIITSQPSDLVTKKINSTIESESLIDKVGETEFRNIGYIPETKWEPEGVRYGPEYFILPSSHSQRYNYNKNDINRDTRNNQMRPKSFKVFDQPIIRQNEIPRSQSNQQQVYDSLNRVSASKEKYNDRFHTPPAPAQPSLGRQDYKHNNKQRKAYNTPNQVPISKIDHVKLSTPSSPPQQAINSPNHQTNSIPIVDYTHRSSPPPPQPQSQLLPPARPSFEQKDYNHNNNIIDTRKANQYQFRNPDISESRINYNQFNVHNSAQRGIQNKPRLQSAPGQTIAIEEIVHSQGSRVNQWNRLAIQPELLVKIIRHYFANALTPEESRLTFERKAPLILAKQSRLSPHLNNHNKYNK